jgi:iron complex transport system permease protein
MIHPALIKKQRIILCALLGLIGVTAVIGAGMGYSSLSYGRLIPTLLGQGTFKTRIWPKL